MIQKFDPLFQDSQTMTLKLISTLSLSWKIIISPHLFKRVEADLVSSPPRRKFSQMLQPVSSIFIIVTYILK